jgi:hypothetical protein
MSKIISSHVTSFKSHETIWNHAQPHHVLVVSHINAYQISHIKSNVYDRVMRIAGGRVVFFSIRNHPRAKKYVEVSTIVIIIKSYLRIFMKSY